MNLEAYSVPEQYQKFADLHDKQLAHAWNVPLDPLYIQDFEHWSSKSLIPQEIKDRLSMVIRALVLSEKGVISNLGGIQDLMVKSLPKKVVDDLVPLFLAWDCFKSMEGVHFRSYAIMDRILHPFSGLEDKIRNSMNTKLEILQSWNGDENANTPKECSEALIHMAFGEGLDLNSLFTLFQYFETKALLPQSCTVNKEVLTDESIHTEMAILAYRILTDLGILPKLSNDEIYTIAEIHVNVDDLSSTVLYGGLNSVEKEFLSVINEDNAKTYTRILANGILRGLQVPELYTNLSKNPYAFATQSLLSMNEFFFDKQVVNYGEDIYNEIVYEEDPKQDDEY